MTNGLRVRRQTQLRAAGLYLVTDEGLTARHRFAVVEHALRAGTHVVQLRLKAASARQFLDEAQAMRRLTAGYDALFIVNDRVDVAIAAAADGVHVGQEDLPAAVTRRLVGPEMLIGVSASTPAEAEAAVGDGADYVGFGAMFPTPTKLDAEYAGPSLLREAAARVKDVPLVAIGGINVHNVSQVVAAGANLVAVVTAISRAPSPAEMTRALLVAAKGAAIDPTGAV